MRWSKDYQDLIDMGRMVARAIDADIFYRNRETLYGCHTCEYENTCLGSRQKKATMEPETPF